MKRLTALLLVALLLLIAPAATLAEEAAAPQKAGVDLMLVLAHPGDELLYMGGVLPYYAVEKGYSVVVVYLTGGDETSRMQARKTLRAMGVGEEPVFGCFPDKYTEKLEDIEELWQTNATQEFLMRVIRQYRPAIIVTHDVNGEYGHAAHVLAAKQVLYCVLKSNSTGINRKSVAKYGVWQPLRVYCHLYGEKNFTIDRTQPLSAYGGRSAAAVETALYPNYTALQAYSLSVTDPIYSAAAYGLAYRAKTDTTDPTENDFFSGIDPSLLSGVKKQRAVSLTTTQIDLANVAANYTNEAQYFRSAGDPAEVIVEDWENEHWEYRTDDLSIIVDRIHTKSIGEYPICYCVAQVRMRNVDAFRPGVRGDNTTLHQRTEFPTYMARRYHAVLAVTGDNLDVAEPELKGIILRNGLLYNNGTAADTAALYPDMTLRIFRPGETSVEQLLADGVLNTFSFGPTLIRDGVVNLNASRTLLGMLNPRTGIGMVEPGHFVVITVDGRQSSYSRGVSLNTFMHLFYVYGCKQAYNLDGGNSMAMVFMGEHLNQHPGDPNTHDGQRALPDMLMWGDSEQVPSVDDPVYHDSSPDDE